MRVDLFDYHLPPELIAQSPLEQRDASRLLVVERAGGRITHHAFTDFPSYLERGDVLLLNRSRVRRARLLGSLRGGGRAEILLLRPLDDGLRQWEALGRPSRRLRPGDRVTVEAGRLDFKVVENRGGGELRVELLAGAGEQPEALIEELGRVPLPPYIKGDIADAERYQTVYAARTGSVAAPTAGLHFTPAMLQEVREMGVEEGYVDLQIGLDTFRPVREDEVEQHPMHSEELEVGEETCALVDRARGRGGRAVAVGTTVVRSLETAWREGRLQPFRGSSELFIYPGYRFACTDALLTNFHLPRSTLLMLVCAFGGRELILGAYREAIEERYRFYSFGDAMLII